MVISSFHDDGRKPLISHKMTTSSYLPQMMSDPKNKGTLFSSTFEVEENTVPLFFWFDVNLVRYGNFDFYQIFPI